MLPSRRAFPQVHSTDEELESFGRHGHDPAGSEAGPHKGSLPPRLHCPEPSPRTTPQLFQGTQESGMGVLCSTNFTLAFPRENRAQCSLPSVNQKIYKDRCHHLACWTASGEEQASPHLPHWKSVEHVLIALHPSMPASADLLQRILAQSSSCHLQVVCHWARGSPLKLSMKCAQGLWGGWKDMMHMNNRHAPRFVGGKRWKY